jgi:purine-nucleoside phosphorylase
MPDAMKLVTMPIRIFQALQIPNLILSNAVGCVNESFQVGELMIIKDHINLMGNNPLL